MSDLLEEIDWVKRRAKCSAGRTFMLLAAGITADVQQAKEENSCPDAEFKIDQKENMVMVTRTRDLGGPKEELFVVFDLKTDGIHASRASTKGGRKPISKGIPSLDENGECQLLVDGTGMPLWKFRRLALEDLFFTV